MLVVILGNVGTGKTLFLVMLAKLSKLPVVSNFKLNFDFEVFDLEKFVRAEYDNVDILLDEAYAYLESRVSISELNRLMSYILFQSRKKSINLFLTAQLLSTLDKRFRAMADMLILCNHKDKSVEPYRYKIISRMHNTIINKVISYEVASKYYELYDTNEVINSVSIDVNDFFKQKLSGKDKMSQIQIIANDLLNKYDKITITKSIVSLYFTEMDLPSFLVNDTYTFIKLNKPKKELKKKKKKTKKK